MRNETRDQGVGVVKYQGKYQEGEDKGKGTVVTKGSQVCIQEGVERIAGKGGSVDGIGEMGCIRRIVGRP